MKRSKEELLQIANTIVGENSTDEVISFLEDIADSVGADEVEIEGENWELKYREDMEKWEQERIENAEKYRQLDETWRKRYKDRFSGVKTDEEYEESDTKEISLDDNPNVTFDDLFKK